MQSTWDCDMKSMPIKIAFVSGGYTRADRIGSWSGTPYFMRRALEESGCELQNILISEPKFMTRDVVAKIAHKLFGGRRRLLERTPRRLAILKRELARQLIDVQCDVVFAPGSIYVAALPARHRAAYWADACFAGMVDFYEDFSNLSAAALRDGHAVERQALRRAVCAFYSSSWAADGARQVYGENTAKILTVPLGANLAGEVSAERVHAAIKTRGRGTIRLLFIGVDWFRKGGSFACDVALRARARGIPVEFDILGCEPPKGAVPEAPWVRSHGFISKKTAAGRNQLTELMLAADWLILPTRAECYGLVFAEASAHGVPSLATAVGGVPTVVVDGKNGFVFPLEAGVDDWVARIEAFCGDRARYEALATSTRMQYEERLNWKVAGETVVRHLTECCRTETVEVGCMEGKAREPGVS
jgi:glycosyltransferase involved in cell wall biosynthesis